MRYMVGVCAALVGCRVDNGFDKVSSSEEGGSDSAAPPVDTSSPDCVPEAEVCDGIDNDCDGLVDEDVELTFYVDQDGDGFGDPSRLVTACAQPDGTADNGDDCQDNDSSVFPGAVETCDDRDEDCDALVDEDVPRQVWYRDQDNDGWGNPDDPVEDCRQPEGTTDQLSDCDDLDASRHYCESCAEVLARGWSTGDGTYDLETPGCGLGRFWCDMTTDGGGWTGTVDWDFAIDPCPGTWQFVDLGFALACARSASSSTDVIRTAALPACGIPWMSARVDTEMFQYGSTDAFGDYPSLSVDEAYGDVVSLTVGAPRTHLFSWAFGFKSGGTDDSNCPSIGGAAPPAFVGSDYLCETGNPSASSNSRIWYDTPLFSAGTVQVVAPAATTDDLEMRLIGTHVSTDEDMAVSSVRLMIR